MKGWLKVLIWLGLGGGIGFFGGIQVGRRIERKMQEDAQDTGDTYEGISQEEADRAMAVYRGDEDGDEAGVVRTWLTPNSDEKATSWVERMDAERYPKTDVEIHEGRKVPDIPVLHPQDMVGVPISEEEWNENPENYERKTLIFYGLDEVVYDEKEAKVIENPDSLLGPGCIFGFHGDPNNPVETLYFQNSTMGTLYRLDYVDDAFCDVYGTEGPEDDWPEPDEYDVSEEDNE